MTISRKAISVMATTILSGLGAIAVPAMIGLIPVNQPDGSVINIRMTGDERMHFTTTEDGRLLTQRADGYYCFADFTEEGRIISTDIIARQNSPKNVGTRLIDLKDKINTALLREDGIVADQAGLGLMTQKYPTTGSPVVPVILVEYQDVKFQPGYDVKEYFTDMICGENYHENEAPGSVASYFKEQSKGVFTPQFDIYGPVTLPYDRDYYGADAGYTRDAKAHQMVSHAVEILDPDVDFSIYDADNDDNIDFIYIIYAGDGQHRGGGDNTVWPHAGELKRNANFKLADGKWLNSYACSNEWATDRFEGMSAFLHEYSHVIGLPDLYSTDAYNFHYYTPGPYTILDYGLYNNNGFTPCNYSAFEKNALKWDEPVAVIDKPMKVTLRQGEFAVVPTTTTNEFFLLENRQLDGWDAALPYHGMVVWHVDYVKSRFSNNEVNNNPDHLYVDLIEANNIPGFENNGSLFWSNCEEWTFPGKTDNREFTAKSTPAFLTWAETDLGLPITDIEEKDGVISFVVAKEQLADNTTEPLGKPVLIDPAPGAEVITIETLSAFTIDWGQEIELVNPVSTSESNPAWSGFSLAQAAAAYGLFLDSDMYTTLDMTGGGIDSLFVTLYSQGESEGGDEAIPFTGLMCTGMGYDPSQGVPNTLESVSGDVTITIPAGIVQKKGDPSIVNEEATFTFKVMAVSYTQGSFTPTPSNMVSGGQEAYSADQLKEVRLTWKNATSLEFAGSKSGPHVSDPNDVIEDGFDNRHYASYPIPDENISIDGNSLVLNLSYLNDGQWDLVIPMGYVIFNGNEVNQQEMCTYRVHGGAGITSITIDGEKIVYNLQGVRVENPSNGIFIVNGKKVLVK